MRAWLSLLLAMAVGAGASNPLAHAQDAHSARQFVESLYKLYTKDGSGVPSFGPHARRYYHSSLLALMKADERAVGPGNVGAIDGDPVCGCQDWEGIFGLQIAIQMQSTDRAIADVVFELSARASSASQDGRHLIITLVPENSEWRIWNVRDESDPQHPFDVRNALEHEIRQIAKPFNAKPRR